MRSITFSKLVSTPTETVWSQIYNAGNLFATLTLIRSEETEENHLLSSVGKNVFSNLEAEFFTLETKDLTGIKDAILKSLEAVPDGVSAHLNCAYFKENVLYVYIYGEGKIVMKRDNKTGTLLEGETNEKKILSASGVLENNDLIILETAQFAKDIQSESFAQALDLELPNDIAEALSPIMHETDDGGQAAVIIKFQAPNPHDETEYEKDESEEDVIAIPDEAQEELAPAQEEKAEYLTNKEEANTSDDREIHTREPDIPIHNYADNPAVKSSFLPLVKQRLFSFLKIAQLSRMNHRRKLFLSVAIVIFVILASSIILARANQEDKKTQALFESIYTPALKDYEDGKSIQSINESFARDEFISARDRLKEGDGKFEDGSDEAQKIADLLSKIEAELGVGSGVKKIEAREVDLDSDELLSVALSEKNNRGIARDENSIYVLTNDAVINASDDEEIIENENDWKAPLALSSYQGNMYILDREEGVIKYTAGSDGFGKSSYFKSKPSNAKDAVSMSIDGSVWILFKDGSIGKYTSGESDGFRIKGVDTAFKKATRIMTSLDTESVYVLDNGNSRIVKLSKEGNFEDQYVADILSGAKEIEVLEEKSIIRVLSGGKFWEINL
jgi:hypothetical protein